MMHNNVTHTVVEVNSELMTTSKNMPGSEVLQSFAVP